MTKKMNLVWRLGKLPSPEEVRELVKDKIITQEEARNILFSSETEEEKDIKSLEEEIKFLKGIIEQMSKNRVSVVESIRYVEKPRITYPWYKDTIMWCSSIGSNSIGGNVTNLIG